MKTFLILFTLFALVSCASNRNEEFAETKQPTAWDYPCPK